MCVGLYMVGYFLVYEIWLSMLFGSFLCMLRVMVVVFFPVRLVITSLSVFVICRWFSSAKAFSLATRYMLSFGLGILGWLCRRG